MGKERDVRPGFRIAFQFLALLPSLCAAIAMPSELDSTRVVETIDPQNFPPLPPGVSFQDIDSESGSEDGGDEEDWDAILAACTSSLLFLLMSRAERSHKLFSPLAEAAFSQEEADEMISFLKERGLFAFVKHYVEVNQMPIPKLLLAFGVLIVSGRLPRNALHTR